MPGGEPMAGDVFVDYNISSLVGQLCDCILRIDY
jgi:hypothetical protein